MAPRGTKAIFALVCLLFCKLTATAYPEPIDQATVEAAICLQLLSFTEWPAEQDGNALRKIGVFSSQAHAAAFQDLSQTPGYQDRFSVAVVDEEMSAEELARFDAIFFHAPDDTAIPRIIRRLEGQPVVLIGAFDGFLEEGGLVNLVKIQKKLRFEINLQNSKERGISYRAKLLRLAAKIVEE